MSVIATRYFCHCYCYAVILSENIIRGELYPAFVVCWDSRANNDSQVFTLRRLQNVNNPVVTTTPDDVYELKELYKNFRFSVRDKWGRPRKTYIKGILVACHCNDDCSQIAAPFYFISYINNTSGNPNDNLQRWQSAYLDKEKSSQIYDWADILTDEDRAEISTDYTIPTLYRRRKNEESVRRTERD